MLFNKSLISRGKRSTASDRIQCLRLVQPKALCHTIPFAASLTLVLGCWCSQVVELIASFIGTDTSQDPELLQVAVERSSIQYMKEHSRKFDEHHLKLRINEQCGLDKMAGLCGRNNGKVREGKVGGWQAEMPQALQEAFEARWRGEVLPETGYATYAELRAAVNMELKRPWAK